MSIPQDLLDEIKNAFRELNPRTRMKVTLELEPDELIEVANLIKTIREREKPMIEKATHNERERERENE